jgi:hypothetical protein
VGCSTVPIRCFSTFISLIANDGGTNGTAEMLWTFRRVIAATASAMRHEEDKGVQGSSWKRTCVVDAQEV